MNREELLMDKLWNTYCETMGYDATDKKMQHCFFSGMACVCTFVTEGSEQVAKGMDKNAVAKSFMHLQRHTFKRMKELSPEI